MTDRAPTSAPPPALADAVSRRRRAYRALVDAAVGAFLTLLLIYGEHQLEQGRFGRQVEHMAYTLQQLRLGDIADTSTPLVRVIDISEWPLTRRTDAGDPLLVTDRAQLGNLIALLEKQRQDQRKSDRKLPLMTFGIDVLLDPPDGKLTNDERTFLDLCLKLTYRGKQRAFVGVFDNIALGPARWLGDAAYAPIAASALVPRPIEFGATDHVVNRLELPLGERSELRSLAFKVADASGTQSRGWIGSLIFSWFSGLIEQWAPIERQPFEGEQALINYGILSTLEGRTVPVRDVPSTTIEEPIVIIGRAQNTIDTFVVPGRSEPVAGVYVQAAAVYTLVQAPLYKFTPTARVVVDLVASVIPIGFVLGWRLFAIAGQWRYGGGHGLPLALTVGTAVVVFLLGHLWIVVTGILWTDYLMVTGALLLHAAIERPLAKLLNRGHEDHAAGAHS